MLSKYSAFAVVIIFLVSVIVTMVNAARYGAKPGLVTMAIAYAGCIMGSYIAFLVLDCVYSMYIECIRSTELSVIVLFLAQVYCVSLVVSYVLGLAIRGARS